MEDTTSHRTDTAQRAEEPAYPLSYGQQALWLIQQQAPESPAYHIAIAAYVHSPVDVPVLRQCVQTLVERHPALRSTFSLQDDEPVQQVHPPHPDAFQHIDASGCNDVELREQVLAAHRRPFDLTHGPVFRVDLFTCRPDHHVLLIIGHHLVWDGRSYYRVFDELRTLYAALKAGQTATLPSPAYTYADYITWQARLLEAEGDRLSAYWHDRLGNDLPLLNLPTDHPRPPVQTYDGGAMEAFAFSQAFTQRLRALAKAEETTLFRTLMAAFQVLLYRYIGQAEFLVGMPTAGHIPQECHHVVGYYVNTLILRINLCGQPTFRSVLEQVYETTSEALQHQAYPFGWLVKQLQPQRNPSAPQLVQVVFNFPRLSPELAEFWMTPPEQGGSIRPIDGGGLALSPFGLLQQAGIFDLNLEMDEGRDGLLGAFKYNTSLFEASTIQRLVGHFETLLHGIVANPDQPIATLPLLTEPERQQVLVQWNATQSEYPSDTPIHQLVEAQAACTPDAVAIVFENQALTYRALNCRANQLAHYLRAHGVGPETLVALCIKRSLEMVVGMLGILKAGGAYVPLDPAYPQDRLAFMLADMQASMVLTQERLVAELPPHHVQMLCLDRDWPRVETYPTHNPVHTATPGNLAYAIYTSGSTGQPKGVLIRHGGLLNLVFWHQRAFAITADDRATQLVSLSFDISVWEIWPYLAIGATLHLAPPELLAAPVGLRDWLVEQAISVGIVPTPVAEPLVRQVWPANTALRLLLTGGDKLQHGTLAGLPFGYVNNYGPTENSVVSTAGDVEPECEGVPSIGRPIANVQSYILDRHVELIPQGWPGELWLSGESLARGYHGRAGLTAEKFIPNPFGAGRLYRTGDLVRYRPDGAIEFLGRIDNQVQIRGFRIELGEIEAVLSQHPEVRDAVVIVREDPSGDKRLVAYVVASAPPSPVVESESDQAEALRAFLQHKLPDYMIPAALVFLPIFPLTPNGKLDRRALPVPGVEAFTPAVQYVGPRTPVEEQLTAIWEEMLGVNPIGVHDDFFALGGHSLLGAQVVSRIRTVFSVALPLQSLFDAQTIAEVAEQIEELKVMQALRVSPAVDGEAREGISI